MNIYTRTIAWAMWFLTTLFFGFQFILRLTPGLVFSELLHKFNIDSVDYGYFAAMYYAGYAGLQIPVAILLDKYGPRVVVFICALLCSLFSLTIVYSDSWFLVLLGRFFVGAGSAAGFLGVAKVLSIWFSPSQYARMVGITFSFGLLGAVFGSAPVSMLMSQYGWRSTVEFVGYSGILISILILLLVKPMPKIAEELEHNVISKLKNILTNKYIVLLAISNLLLVGSLEGFADVWGVPYLESTYGYPRTIASSITMWVYIGMLFGGPILAFFAEKYNAYFQTIAIAGAIMSSILLSLAIFTGVFPYGGLTVMMFIIGICCCYQVIVLSLASILSAPSEISITIAFLNSINMLGGTLFHSTIGNVLNLFWDGTVINDVAVYSQYAYNLAISAIPIIGLIGVLINIWLSLKVTVMKDKEASDEELVYE